MGAAHVEQLGPRARVVRRLLVEPDVVVGAVRRLGDVPDRVVESLRVGAPRRLPRLRSERGGEVEIAAAVQRVDDDVVGALVCDARAVGRPGRAVLADAGGIRDVLRRRARRREIEDVDVERRRPVPSANAIFVRSGDQVGWRCCSVSPVASAGLMDPPPALPMTGRRKSCVLPNAGPLMRTIRPFVPGSTAPAAAGRASAAARASPMHSGRRTTCRT